MPLALIPFLLLIVPIVEIAVFISVGSAIGVWPTIGFVILTAVLGSIFLRRQGLSTLSRIKTEVDAGRVPGRELVSGVMIAIAGVLLLTPGFVTDALGFLLFVPGVRDAAFNWLKTRVVVVGGRAAAGFGRAAGEDPRRPGSAGPATPSHARRPDVVDLSGEEFRRQPDPSSPWNTPGESDGNRTLH